jgi:hypothetical protein
VRLSVSTRHTTLCVYLHSELVRGGNGGEYESHSAEACVCVCFITAGPITKMFAWGEEESGGHVL